MGQPLVSVICLCHNHSGYVQQAIQSVWNQTYSHVELIVVDDGSTDGSQEVIATCLKGSSTKFIRIEKSVGNCAAFNKGFQASKGAFIIDLAADDLLMPERIAVGVEALQNSKAGVTFCDVMHINADGIELYTHYKRDKNGRLEEQVPQGNVYRELIEKYFISPPSMMMKRQVLENLGGYDEQLSYEDFDFWIRSSRFWDYVFTDQVLVKKRILKNSLSSRQFRFRSSHQQTTLEVCKKIKKLNKTKAEDLALRKRCFYEIKQCLKQGNFQLIPGFLELTQNCH